jgi:hypothetical protein
MPKGGAPERSSRTAANRPPERFSARGVKERSRRLVSRRGTASVRQLTLPLGRAVHGDELAAGTRRADAPAEGRPSTYSAEPPGT